MKRRIVEIGIPAVVVVSVLMIVSCRKPVTAPLGQPFTLHVGQAARFMKSDLEIYFRRVASDSRCPRGAQCVTAGEAIVTLEGRILKGPPESFEVGLAGGDATPGANPGRAYDGNRIRLFGLEPVPVVGAAADSTAYVATLEVEKR